MKPPTPHPHGNYRVVSRDNVHIYKIYNEGKISYFVYTPFHSDPEKVRLQNSVGTPLCFEKIVSEYDLEISQSQTVDKPMAPR